MTPNKKIYFASDFHLGVPTYEESLVREKKIVAWLDEVKQDAEEIYLLGDVFDFWFEYKHAIPKGFIRLQGKIAELTDSGIKIHWFLGNHDMWIFDYIPKELGVELYRYKRYSDTLSWEIKDVWSVKLTSGTAEVVEENKRRIKMGFAISYSQYWDGNALNNDDKEECYYTNIAQPFTVDNFTVYDSTAIVEHSNELNYVQYLRHYEVYAANVGKIYSVDKDLTLIDGDTLNIEKGHEVYYSIVEYGHQ